MNPHGKDEPARMPVDAEATIKDAVVWARQIAAGKWPGVGDTFTAMRLLAPELERLQAAERALRVCVAGLERDAVDGGVLCADVPTADVRAAFGWSVLPQRLLERCSACRGSGLRGVSNPVRPRGFEVSEPLEDCEVCGGLGVLVDEDDALASYRVGELIEIVTGPNMAARGVIRQEHPTSPMIQLFAPEDDDGATGMRFYVKNSREIRRVSE